MIPRFTVNNILADVMDEFIKMGYKCSLATIPNNVMLIGDGIIPALPPEKNALLKVVDCLAGRQLVLSMAATQLAWPATKKVTIPLGTQQIEVQVSTSGVLIDSCIVPIRLFTELEESVNNLKSPFIVSHTPIINPKVRFMTIGCADYSVEDLNKILNAYKQLKSDVKEN